VQKSKSQSIKVSLDSNGGLVSAGRGHGIEAVVWAMMLVSSPGAEAASADQGMRTAGLQWLV